ncbi:unnamed protein product, partial [Symbiodinium pilosum]
LPFVPFIVLSCALLDGGAPSPDEAAAGAETGLAVEAGAGLPIPPDANAAAGTASTVPVAAEPGEAAGEGMGAG